MSPQVIRIDVDKVEIDGVTYRRAETPAPGTGIFEVSVRRIWEDGSVSRTAHVVRLRKGNWLAALRDAAAAPSMFIYEKDGSL